MIRCSFFSEVGFISSIHPRIGKSWGSRELSLETYKLIYSLRVCVWVKIRLWRHLNLNHRTWRSLILNHGMCYKWNYYSGSHRWLTKHSANKLVGATSNSCMVELYYFIWISDLNDVKIFSGKCKMNNILRSTWTYLFM